MWISSHTTDMKSFCQRVILRISLGHYHLLIVSHGFLLLQCVNVNAG